MTNERRRERMAGLRAKRDAWWAASKFGQPECARCEHTTSPTRLAWEADAAIFVQELLAEEDRHPMLTVHVGGTTETFRPADMVDALNRIADLMAENAELRRGQRPAPEVHG